MTAGRVSPRKQVRQVGRKAFVVAIFGTFLPLLAGVAVVGLLFDGEYYPSGFAAGCAFAPTSIDISIKLLEESKMLNTLAGQVPLAFRPLPPSRPPPSRHCKPTVLPPPCAPDNTDSRLHR